MKVGMSGRFRFKCKEVLEWREKKQEVVAGGLKAASWVDVAHEKKMLRKYNLEITELDGHSNVEIPDEVVVNANPLWEDFLIGKFLDTAPHIARIHAVVNKIWREGGKGQLVEVHEVDSTMMKFRVLDPAMRMRILRRGMWNIGNIPLVVTKWTPDELTEKPEVKSIPMWVYLKNVPTNMFSWEGLSFITSAAGHPVRLHPETASCSNFKLAKIFINADLSKELPKKINFTKNGKSSLVEFIYPRLPSRCNTCGKWGHFDKDCVLNKKDETFKSVAEIIKHGIEGKATESAEPREEVVEQHVNVETSVVNNTEEEVEKGEVITGWLNVTPGKASKSPKSKTREYEQVKVASRFSALDDADDNGDLVKEIGGKDSEDSLLLEQDHIETDVTSKEMQEDFETGEASKDSEIEGAETTPGAVVSQENHEKLENEEEQEGSVEGLRRRENQSLEGSVIGGNSSLRSSLPRTSKTNHRIVPSKDTETPGPQGKRNNRKSSQ